MPFSQAHKFAFIHVRKTGGTSIMRALLPVIPDIELNETGMWDIICAHPRREWITQRLRAAYPVNTLVDFPQWHLPADIVRAIIGPSAWNRLFSFAFVRNPWELVLSAYEFDLYYYFGDGPFTPKPQERDRVSVLRACPGFADYVRIYPLLEPRDVTSMITDEKGDVIVNFVGKFERLQQDFDAVCRQIRIDPIVLSHENKTVHTAYQDYYTPETRRLVGRYFARDIERFGYEF